MQRYLLRRIFLIIPTLFFIMVLNFVIIQMAPGGPIEQVIAKIKGMDSSVQSRIESPEDMSSKITEDSISKKYSNSYGLDPEFIKDLEKQFGFDKPPLERFFNMIYSYIRFDFGNSYFQDKPVIELIIEALPVSISLGLWSTLIIYLISIPLGIRKAIQDGSNFDIWTSSVIIIGYAIPAFMFSILLIILFAGGNYWNFFPLRGLFSDDWSTFTLWGKIKDYFWHIALPVISITISGFASLTFLTKNSFLDEIKKNYVMTAKSKGLTNKTILYGHVFRNAMLIIISGIPGALIHIFFTGSLLIEIIFSLEGLGLLGFQAALSRDYPVMFASLYIFTLISLVIHLIGDISYTLIDPRIDFEKRNK